MLRKILSGLKEHPGDVCYQIREKQYTNRELYRYVCNIRSYLDRHCGKGDRVVVTGHKEIYMIASFLACLFSGIAYIPVDISVPEERRKKIINGSAPALIIDSSIEDVMDGEDSEDFSDIRISEDDTAYIIFTSGTTGEPKGVQITYGNLRSCMEWLTELCGISCDTVLNQASYSFDLSVADIYLPLLTRSRHYIIESGTQRDFPALFGELRRSGAGLAVMTPSFADYLMADRTFGRDLMPELKKILFCGEKLTEKTVARLYERFGGISIINCYGPTECTFAVTGAEVFPGEEISIGDPKPGVEIHIVGEDMKDVDGGMTGEILITGDSVGKGYLDGRGGFTDWGGVRAYLTGDLAYRKNGKIYYVGRKDRQVKLRGYRIEPAEIETVLDGHEAVERSAVAAAKDSDGKAEKIIAYVKLSRDREQDVTAACLRRYAGRYLPGYMVPVVKIVREIPLDGNGKADIRALMHMDP
ncbi:MAG: AMP-binding protein [Clostridia bacterium]|nr:AMP-binding protein [Clostridia bacterium]